MGTCIEWKASCRPFFCFLFSLFSLFALPVARAGARNARDFQQTESSLTRQTDNDNGEWWRDEEEDNNIIAQRYCYIDNTCNNSSADMKFAVQLTATLDKIDSVKPVDTPDSVFEYTFKIQCTSCREVHPKNITINRVVCIASTIEQKLILTRKKSLQYTNTIQ